MTRIEYPEPVVQVSPNKESWMGWHPTEIESAPPVLAAPPEANYAVIRINIHEVPVACFDLVSVVMLVIRPLVLSWSTEELWEF